MALKKSEKRLLLIMGVVVAAFLVNQIISGGKKKDAAQKSGVVSTVGKAIPALKKDEKQDAEKKEVSAEKITYDSWGRDPFLIKREIPRPAALAAAAAAADTSLQLKGIIKKGRKVYALINDQIIGVGEEKDGIRVEKIEGKEVVCVKNGIRITLQWKG